MTPAQFKAYLQKKNKKHVILDFDQTIATLLMSDNWQEWKIRMHKLLQSYDASFSPVSETEIMRRTNALIDKHGAILSQQMKKINEAYELAHTVGYERNNELIQIIKTLDFCTWSIWSSNSESTLTKAVRELDIAHHITTIISRDHVLKIKPDTEGFHLINPRKDSSSEFLMIGDSEFDKLAAQNAGIEFLFVQHM